MNKNKKTCISLVMFILLSLTTIQGTDNLVNKIKKTILKNKKKIIFTLAIGTIATALAAAYYVTNKHNTNNQPSLPKNNEPFEPKAPTNDSKENNQSKIDTPGIGKRIAWGLGGLAFGSLLYYKYKKLKFNYKQYQQYQYNEKNNTFNHTVKSKAYNDAINEINALRDPETGRLSKKMYKNLLHKYHPDLNPNFSDAHNITVFLNTIK